MTAVIIVASEVTGLLRIVVAGIQIMGDEKIKTIVVIFTITTILNIVCIVKMTTIVIIIIILIVVATRIIPMTTTATRIP